MGWLTERRNRSRGERAISPHLEAIETGLLANDSTRSWNATWDLVTTADPSDRADALVMLRSHINAALHADEPQSGEPTDVRWQRAEQAAALEEAIEHSRSSPRRRLLSSKEVRKHAEQEQARQFRESLDKLGVRQGEGLPAWLLYMSRRSRKSWH